MRHLIDLDTKVAVITWWEKYIFPNGELEQFKTLYFDKYKWKIDLTDENEKKMQELKLAKGSKGIRIEKVEITDMLPQENNTVNPTTSINERDWYAITRAIINLEKSIDKEPITVDGVFELSDSDIL